MQAKRKRLPRIEREEISVARDDENAHLWAISYADFLMAILSFFILFYSADPAKRNTFVVNLAKEFSTKSTGAAGAGAGSIEASTNIPPRLPKDLNNLFKEFNVSVEQVDEILVLNFADNFFSPGGFAVADDHVSEVKEVLLKIKPFEDQVNLYFEGHADDRPVKIHKNSLLKDNFVLSSLRASSALLLAKEVGFSEAHLFIQAASSNIRNSRSLSIRIEPRGARL